MTLKSLDELNRDFIFENHSNEKKDTRENREAEAPVLSKKKRGAVAIAADVLFYFAILMILLSAMTSGPNGGEPKKFLGFSYFTVLTSSMQNEIPKGAFILVHQTNPEKLKVGDNITYMRDHNTSVTHKVVNVYDNYQGSGIIGFQTKGVNNANPDKEIVEAPNVVGKVIAVVPTLGAVIVSLRANIYLVFIIFGLSVILSFSLRGLFTKPIVRAIREAGESR